MLWFTLYDNYTLAVVCLHLFYVVSCTVITKSGARRNVPWDECDFCRLHYIFTRGSFPCPLFFFFVLIRSANSEQFGHSYETTKGLATLQDKSCCEFTVLLRVLKCNHQHREQQVLSGLFTC